MFLNVTQKSFIPSIRNLCIHTLSQQPDFGKYSILKKKKRILAQIFDLFQIFRLKYSSISVGPIKENRKRVQPSFSLIQFGI